MQLINRTGALFLVLAMLAGCASTKVTEATPMVSPGLRRPKQIWVYDFVADPSKIPADSSVGASLSAPATPPTAQELESGRQLGAAIAKELVADIQAMGLPAAQAGPGSVPQVGDGVIRGYLVSMQGGSATKRFVIGFGQGSSDLETVVEGFAVTPTGWRKMGSGTLESSSGKMPGMVMPGAIAIATGNPIGVAVMGGMKAYGELSGKNTIQGRAKSTADAIAEQLKVRFRQRGWIS